MDPDFIIENSSSGYQPGWFSGIRKLNMVELVNKEQYDESIQPTQIKI